MQFTSFVFHLHTFKNLRKWQQERNLIFCFSEFWASHLIWMYSIDKCNSQCFTFYLHICKKPKKNWQQERNLIFCFSESGASPHWRAVLISPPSLKSFTTFAIQYKKHLFTRSFNTFAKKYKTVNLQNKPFWPICC